jgi:hypothetical protein
MRAQFARACAPERLLQRVAGHEVLHARHVADEDQLRPAHTDANLDGESHTLGKLSLVHVVLYLQAGLRSANQRSALVVIRIVFVEVAP